MCVCFCKQKKIGRFVFELVFFLCRSFTAVEVRKKLLGKRYSPDTVEAVINDFQRRCENNS
jgi:hypothetical protein